LRRFLHLAVFLAVCLTIAFVIAGVVLAEATLRARGPRRPLNPPHDVQWRPALTTGADGTRLSGWVLLPQQSNGKCVMMLHGIGDTRSSGIPLARMLVGRGYTVLLADGRGHGASGGFITFGLHEKDDVMRWATLLASEHCPGRVYGLGESMGAGILIQALPGTPDLRAIVAECAFADFPAIARLRVVQHVRLPAPITRTMAYPLIGAALLYSRWRHDLDYGGISPEAALRATGKPVLFIHGLADDNIPPDHSRRLYAARPAGSEIWLVPGAGHTRAYGTAGREFEDRVLAWFETH
jgi:dipeptidyl aminopeptidase/acylaminoacyl peptidase